ncbi:MAG: AMP-binding protein [Candidatus Choladocola sp.]|nr:AMP-binding protein [Candidatus Choladocola sp.]
MKKIKAAKGAAVCMGLLAAAEAGGTAYFYNIALKRNSAKVERTIKMAGTDWDQYRPMMKVRKEYLLSQPHEDVFLHADDGLRLHATWFPQGNLEKTVICFHGYTSKGMNDFIGLSDYYLKRGYSMLLVDERAHGESEGVYIGFGCLDRWDAMKWIAWAVETCGQQVQILFHGDSMGGATVLMTSSLDLPPQVKGIISDCAFTSAKEVFTHVLHSMYHLPAFPIMQISDFVNKRKAGYGLDECNSAVEVRNAKVPILMIHGSADSFVPCSMCDTIYENCSAPKKKLIIEGAAHVESYYKDPEAYEPKPDQLATSMFTSGTTGKSKGVMLTHRNLAENATCLDMKLPERSVLLSVLPIHHAYCLSMDILKGVSLGSIICINDSLIRMAKNIKLFAPNIILMVPLMIETMAKKLEDAAGLPPEIVKREVFGEQFQTICSGGAYLPPSMLDLFGKYGITILQGYGMTECAPVISTSVSWNIRKGSVGQLMPNCEAKVVDEELWVKGSSVMQGYYKMPQETKETLVDGWLRTGDLGYVDEEGFVYLTGRKKNLIITKNGENVSPEELENKIGENRLVQEILVREKEGMIEAEIFPDYEYAGKKGITDLQAALQEVIDRYNSGAPSYKKVYRLKVRETEFPKTPSKKIKRY